MLLIDCAVEPNYGDHVVLSRGTKSYCLLWEGEKPEGYKNHRIKGVVTHVIKCVYKHPDDILNAEFITSEVSE